MRHVHRTLLLFIVVWGGILPRVSLHVTALVLMVNHRDDILGRASTVSTAGPSSVVSTYTSAALVTAQHAADSASHVVTPTTSDIPGAPGSSRSDGVADGGKSATIQKQAQVSTDTAVSKSTLPSASSVQPLQDVPPPPVRPKGASKVAAYGVIVILVFGVVVWAKLGPLFCPISRSGARTPDFRGPPSGWSTGVQQRRSGNTPRRRATEDRIEDPAPAYASAATLPMYDAASAFWSAFTGAVPAGHRAIPDPEIPPIPLVTLPPPYSPPAGLVSALSIVPEDATDSGNETADSSVDIADAVSMFDEPEEIEVSEPEM